MDALFMYVVYDTCNFENTLVVYLRLFLMIMAIQKAIYIFEDKT